MSQNIIVLFTLDLSLSLSPSLSFSHQREQAYTENMNTLNPQVPDKGREKSLLLNFLAFRTSR
jgi:hypothetical protein